MSVVLKKRISWVMGIILLIPLFCCATVTDSLSLPVESLSFKQKFIHSWIIEEQPTFVFRSNEFLKGDNLHGKKAGLTGNSIHVKYAFKFRPESILGQLSSGAYQGIGLAYNTFGFSDELGNPISLYIFHGTTIAAMNPRLSLNYEWNFGLSFNWKPYADFTNYYNTIIGSKVNAYLNVGIYLSWMLSPLFDLNTGMSLGHFSNGNTKFPNAGLNTTSLKIGLAYNFNRKLEHSHVGKISSIVPFEQHMNYDLILFGSWRRRGVYWDDEHVAAPGAYGVAGFNFASMYNWNYRFKTGISLDGVYDSSANVYVRDQIVSLDEPIVGPDFARPSFHKQVALGLSGRVEYVMPYCSITTGLGVNVLSGGGDLKGFYQILALKVDMTKNTFLHIGYNLQNFKDPNYLMFGLGIRFHNKRKY